LLLSGSVNAQEYYPREAGSWGGVVRNGPGMNYAQIDGLQNGDPVTLLSNSGVWMNGYPWFEIRFKNGRQGYKWGGILCGYGQAIQGLHQTCERNNGGFNNNAGNNGNNGNNGFSGYPKQAGSWGGVLRNGPGMNYAQIGSLNEGDRVTLLEQTAQWMNGYPWFRIRTNRGNVGYQWGGIMCGIGGPEGGLHQQCPSNNNQHNAGNHGSNSGNVTGAGGRILRRNVSFAPGSISTNISGGFARGEREELFLDASGGQNMHVSIGSIEQNAIFTIFAGRGDRGQQIGSGSDQWTGQLPYNGSYTIVVESTRGGTSYNLFVEIQ